MPACQLGLRTNVPACQRACVSTHQKCANFSFLCANVLMCHTSCRCFNLACQRAKRCANFSNIPLTNNKGNFFILLLHKKFYIILNIIVIHITCTCIAYENCIILYFYTLCRIKKVSRIFLIYYFFLFCSLVRNENIKRPGFYTLQVARVSSNFPQLKQLNKIKNTCEYCDLLEL